MIDDHKPVYAAILQAQSDGVPAALVTIIRTQGSMPRHTGSKMLVYADGRTVGTIGGGAMESLAVEEAQAALVDGQTRRPTYTLNDLNHGDPGICGGSAELFVEPLFPPPTLLVVGAGHTGAALAELGLWMGYRVILSDDRAAFCNPERVPGLTDYVVCAPEQLTERVQVDKHTYVTALTRGLPVDTQLLPALLRTEAAYIGLIGSRRRWALTVKTLKAQGLSDTDLVRVHSPIGLELEAETPKEIALSIMAQITMLRRGGTGQPMSRPLSAAAP